jgi:hypothetical protein
LITGQGVLGVSPEFTIGRKGDVNPQSVYESRPTGSPENDYKRDVRSQIWLGFEFLGGWWKGAGISALFTRLKINSCILVHKY